MGRWRNIIFCSFTGQREREVPVLGYPPVPPLTEREMRKGEMVTVPPAGGCLATQERMVLVGCWETGISLAGETLCSNSPCPELELRLQVAQRIQAKTLYTRSVWMPGLPASCHVEWVASSLGSQLEISKFPKAVNFPPSLPAGFRLLGPMRGPEFSSL